MEFDFKARGENGIVQKGVVEANNIEAAIEGLQSSNLIVVSIVPKHGFRFKTKIFQRIKTNLIVDFSRQLAILFSAKSPLGDALKVISLEVENESFKEIILNIAKDVEAGLNFSRALAKYPSVFNDFYVNLIRAGESVGKLEETLIYIADYMERQYYLNQKVTSALIYPAFVVVGLFIAAAVMMTFVVPQITAILQETNQQLPFITRVIVGMSNFLRTYWYGVFGGLALLIAGFYYYVRKTLSGKQFWDVLQLKIPIFKDIFRKIYITRISEALHTLIIGGLPLLESLDICSDIVSNSIYRAILKQTSESVKRGGSISGVFRRYRLFMPSLVTQMIFVGESAGKLDFVLDKIATFYQKEVSNTMDNLVALIEPILILILGTGVGILIVSILLPIYNLASAF